MTTRIIHAKTLFLFECWSCYTHLPPAAGRGLAELPAPPETAGPEHGRISTGAEPVVVNPKDDGDAMMNPRHPTPFQGIFLLQHPMGGSSL